MISSGLKALFEPKSIVLVGASDLAGENRIYSELFSALVRNVSSFKGARARTVDLNGKIAGSEKKMNKVPKELDLAILLLPKELLFKNLQNLLTRRVKALILVSWDLKDDQRGELLDLIGDRRMAFLGPGSIGVINTANGFIAVPERGQISRGHVAVVSQDFCVSNTILDRARLTGISKFVSLGDGLGIDEADLLNYLSQDKDTKAICIYIRNVKDGRKLVGTLKEVVKNKPVLLLKGGADWSGVFSGVMRQAGLLQVHNIQELLNGADGLVRQPLMGGDRVAIVTNLAGQAKLLERYLLEEGLQLTQPSEDVVAKIRRKHPSAKIEGFVDLGPSAKADAYKFVIDLLLSDKNLDGIVALSSLKTTLFDLEDLRTVADVAKKPGEKPIIGVLTCTEDYAVANEIMANTMFPVYSQLDEAAKVLKLLRLRAQLMGKPQKM